MYFFLCTVTMAETRAYLGLGSTFFVKNILGQFFVSRVGRRAGSDLLNQPFLMEELKSH
jgi:hypothetical protein